METVQAAHAAKEQYRQQKPEFLKLVSDNEKLQEELKRKQKQLLKMNLDKYFLFERLLSYEKPPPRKYTKQNKTKLSGGGGSDIANAEDLTESQNEMSISSPPRLNPNDRQAQKTEPEDNEENLEIDVDTEEDNARPERISLLKRPSIHKDKKSVERKKYKKRRKSVQNSEDKSGSVTTKSSGMSMSSQPIPGGTSLLLSSFSPQHSSRGQP